MPRVSKCDSLPEMERLRLVGRIGEGASWRELASEFNIPAATVREWSERNGHKRSVVAAKRKRFDELMTQPETAQDETAHTETAHVFAHTVASTGNKDADAAAERDAKVARLAGNVAVQVIKRLAERFNETVKPDTREAGMIAAALDKAWATYSRINKLDDVNVQDALVVPTGSFKFMTTLGDDK